MYGHQDGRYIHERNDQENWYIQGRYEYKMMFME